MIDFVEHSNASVFRRDVLRPAHKAKLIEYNETRAGHDLAARHRARGRARHLPTCVQLIGLGTRHVGCAPIRLRNRYVPTERKSFECAVSSVRSPE